MERGLLWLPLLALFIWLVWQGWNEYRKVEAYQNWAKQFERSKYDIYAVLGQKGNNLTLGKPTRTGPIDLQTFSLKDVQTVHLRIDELSVSLETPPIQGRSIALEFVLTDSSATPWRVPFTEVSLAVEWGKYIQGELQRLQVEPH